MATSVGVVVNDETVVWGECWPLLASGIAPFSPDQAGIEKTIHGVISPQLVGQSLESFRELAQRLDGARETVTLTSEVTPAEAGPPKITRRAFFTGRVEPAAPSRSTEQVTVEQPVDASLRYGISQVLVRAVAQHQRKTIAEVVASEYMMGEIARRVPLQGAIGDVQWIRNLSDHLGAFVYTTRGASLKEALGSNAEKAQRWARQTAAQIVASGLEPAPALHLDLEGGLGELYEQNAGKLLGALYGLEQAAKPLLVRVIDPVHLADRDDTIEKMGELSELVKIRGLNVQLAARAGVDSLEDARAFLDSGVVSMLGLDLFRLGSLDQGLQAIAASRAQGIGVLLSGHPLEGGQGLSILYQVALAAGAELLSAPASGSGLPLLLGEILRNMAWQANRN